MRILLLNPPFKFNISRASRWPEETKTGTLYYPFWLSYAAGVLLKAGHKVLLLDAIANKWGFPETIDKVAEFGPELVVIETSTPSICNDVEFVDELSKRSKVKIALTGPHVSALPEQTFKLSENIDYIARNEYEYTILELARTLENNGRIDKVAGLSFKSGRTVIHNPNREAIKDLDKLPFVSEVYKKFLKISDYRYALARHPMIQVWSSRGCPNMCTFCLLPQTMMGRSFRARSPENFVDELEWITKNLPEAKEIFIEDDTFSVDKGRVSRICDLIDKRGLNITWSVNARADIPYEILVRMRETGCRMVIVGYESGNQNVLNNIKKGITIRQATKFTEDAKKAGLKIMGCFMIGLPGDTRETVMETFEFAKKLKPDMAFFQQAIPFPGTEFYEWAKRNRYLIAKDWSEWLDKNGQLNFLVSYPELSGDEIRKLRDRFNTRFNLNPVHLIGQHLRSLDVDEQARLLNLEKDYLSFLIKKKLIR